MKHNILMWLLLIASQVSTIAQSFELGFAIGTSTYQGDISPLGWRVSFQGSQPVKGILVGYKISEAFAIKLGFYNTKLEANDADALDDWRPSRNLSFRTKISEFAIRGEWEILDHWRFFNKLNLKPVLHFGVGIFHFNPQAKHRGIWYDLQPLSTEGQGLPGSILEPYSLTQLVIPFGFGLKYQLTEKISIELSTNPRKTFTDYLDDVSENYYNLDLLKKYKGILAAELAFRGEEIDPHASNPIAGDGRGNVAENDWYIINTLTFSYRFNNGWPFNNNKRVRCPY